MLGRKEGVNEEECTFQTASQANISLLLLPNNLQHGLEEEQGPGVLHSSHPAISTILTWMQSEGRAAHQDLEATNATARGDATKTLRA